MKRFVSSNSLISDKLLLRNSGQCFIAGEWVHSSQSISVFNPSTLQSIGNVADTPTALVESAVEKAKKAQIKWKDTSTVERSKVLYEMSRLHKEHELDLAKILTLEQGKPLEEAKGEIRYASSFYQWFAEECKRVYGDIIPFDCKSQKLIVNHYPIGIVAGITPWNFPSAMIARKLAPALAAGCAFILKPSELTPLSAFAICELANRAGVPHGLLSCVTGDAKRIGSEFTCSKDIRKITFTGSSAVGKLLLEQSAGTVKRCSMELGGNAPLIVFEDCDMSKALDGVMASKFRNMGQTCVSSNRVLVHESVYDSFVHLIYERMQNDLVVGDGFDLRTTQGPLINQKAVEKAEGFIRDAISKGAHALGGSRLGGNFLQPCLILDATVSMRCFSEEVFGPVLPVFKFKSEAEAVEMANDTSCGLVAYVFTEDSGRIWRMMDQLDVGMVGVNCGMVSNAVAPFGGVKESGLGREGSRFGIYEYMETKYTCWKL